MDEKDKLLPRDAESPWSHDLTWFAYWEQAVAHVVGKSGIDQLSPDTLWYLEDLDPRLFRWLRNPTFPLDAADEPGAYCYLSDLQNSSEEALLIVPQAYTHTLWFKDCFWEGDFDGGRRVGWLTIDSAVQWEPFFGYLDDLVKVTNVAREMTSEALSIFCEWLGFLIQRGQYIFDHPSYDTLTKSRAVFESELQGRLLRVRERAQHGSGFYIMSPEGLRAVDEEGAL